MVEFGNGSMIKWLDDGRSFQVLNKDSIDLDLYFHDVVVMHDVAAMNMIYSQL